MITTSSDMLSALLLATAEELDIPPELHAAANAQYRAIGQFLSEHENGGRAGWDIYPQGSFRLGTVVRPVVRGDEYDIDLVCRADIAKTSTTQERLKQLVGDALDEYVLATALTPGAPVKSSDSRRCWTLEYEVAFHMDVLPAIPDLKHRPTGILLTDRDFRKWLESNPIAYGDWFRGRMSREFEAKRIAKAAELRKSVEAVPEWEVKTTLQRVVQVLKCHRDVYFANDLDNRPPSIIITTLAGRAYSGERALADAVLETANDMPRHVEKVGDVWVVQSPVADENFADKWADQPERADRFFEWLGALLADVEKAQRRARAGSGVDEVIGVLEKSMGAVPVRAAAGRVGGEFRKASSNGLLTATTTGALDLGAAADQRRKHTFFGFDEEDR